MRVQVLRTALALLAAGMLSACGTLATRQAPPKEVVFSAEPAVETTRIAVLDTLPDWSFQGRVAVTRGRDGGSGRIDWSQGVGNAAVTLSAPVTRQSWTLRTGPAGAVLEGVPNGPLAGPDAQTLLRETTGWQIPVAALGCWLRGARAGEAAGQAAIAYGADGRPARIEQGGWRIDYDAWGEHAGQPVPTRLNAQRGDDRVRLIVDRWGGE